MIINVDMGCNLGYGCWSNCYLTDARNEGKRIELKRLNKEIELEKIRLKNYDKETEKMRLELEYSKQQLLGTKNR